MDGEQLGISRHGNKKDRRSKCAVQALAKLSMDEKIKPVILDCLKKRTCSKKRVHSPGAPIISKAKNDCESTLSGNEAPGKGTLPKQ